MTKVIVKRSRLITGAPFAAAVLQLTEATDGLHPGEDLFDALPRLLTVRLTRDRRGADVDHAPVCA